MEAPQENRYRFLFPFERVPRGARIVIYGAGRLGQEYLHQLMISHYCKVVALADRNHAAYHDIAIPVIAPEEIHTQTFDYVLIALRTRTHFKEFLSVLQKQGIPKEIIIDSDERKDCSIFKEKATVLEDEKTRAYHLSERNLLVSFSGGYGDCIIYKKIMEAFVRLDPGLQIDIFTSRGEDFLRFLYSDMPQVRNIELNLGARYRDMMGNYAAAITFYSHALHVDVLQQEGKFSKKLKKVLCQLRKITQQENPSYKIPFFTAIYRTIFQGGNAYDRLSYHGIVSITEDHVHVPKNEEAVEELDKKHLGIYITLNFGNGSAGDAKAVAKSWPKERFEKVILGIHQEYPEIRILQLGAQHAVRLSGAEHDFLGARWPLVAQLLAHSKLHIDIEGGLVHLATQLGTKCLVLFGPTPIQYFGYPENINLQVGACHGCYGLYEDANLCARNLAEPECMYNITPEMVIEKTKKYLDIALVK